ncbi:MAG: DUF3795 domain-containing protein [Candidatus Thorarchaeota archaeon]
MTNESIAKCGFCCSTCPWSKAVQDSMSSEEYESYKRGCKVVLGYSPSNSFQNCFGCQTPDDQIPEGARLPLVNCITRKCVDSLAIANCAYCSRFPCGHIKAKSTEWSKENLEKKYNKEIAQEDFAAYVEAFEGFTNLQRIRKSLPKSVIVPAKTLPLFQPPTLPFPDNLSVATTESNRYKQLYQLLFDIFHSHLGLEDVDLYPQQEALKKRLKHFTRFLFIFGSYGKLVNNSLVISAQDYYAHRKSETSLTDWNYVRKIILNHLNMYGFGYEIITLKDKKGKMIEYTTPTGALRNNGWQMNLTFSIESSDDSFILIFLKKYCTILLENYGEKAFTNFSKLDMRFLLEN